MTKGGDCFATAAGLLIAPEMLTFAGSRPLVLSEKSPWRIVHGLPVGTSGPVEGLRHWHAWVELTVSHRTPGFRPGQDIPPIPAGYEPVIVLDYSNGKQVKVLRDDFYRIGQLDEEHVWRFTPAEAKAIWKRWCHVGPWVEGWQQMGDGDKEPEDFIEEATP